MARYKRRYPRNYKVTERHTENVGSAGTVNSFGYISSIDPTNVNAWVNNAIISMITNNSTGDETGGIMVYATSSVTFSNTDIIAAKAVPLGGGTFSLRLKRMLRSSLDGLTTDRIYLHVEVTDVTLTGDVLLPTVIEVWGHGHQFTAL